MKLVLDAAIYAKTMRFSMLRTSAHSPGELVNLLIVDTSKIHLLLTKLWGVVQFAVILALIIIFLYNQV